METRYCRKCCKEHEIAYVFHNNSTKHLILLHEKSHIYLPYEDGLNIPIIPTRKQRKELKATAPKEAEVAGQTSLLI